MQDRSIIEPLELRPVVEEFAGRWGCPNPQFVRHFSNVVYLIPQNGLNRYLRVAPAGYRTMAQINAELDFVQHLKAQSLPVASPLVSDDGNLLEELVVGSARYQACVFEEAAGEEFTAVQDLDLAAFFRQSGRLLGEIHEASRSFAANQSTARFHWSEDRWSRFAQLVPESEVAACTFHSELMSWLNQQPRDSTYFGMIHGDYCIGNLRIDGDGINVFDFDACCRHWYAYDIAIFLHYFGAGSEDARKLAYDNVLEGYSQTSHLDRVMQNQIPIFGKMRLLFSYLVFAEQWGFDNLDDGQQRYFDHRRRLFAAEPTWPAI